MSAFPSGHVPDIAAGEDIKVFCFFSSEKKILSYLCSGSPIYPGSFAVWPNPHPNPPHKGEGTWVSVVCFPSFLVGLSLWAALNSMR
jgi:hypothetical protein